MNYKILVILLVAIACISFVFVSPDEVPSVSDPDRENHWVDSVFNKMSEDERIGQLFMIRAHSDLGEEHIQSVKSQIQQYHVGGLCFFQGDPATQIRLTNQYQALSGIPLMIATDAEWGLGMRMPRTTISFPRQLMLGAIQNNRLLYEMGREVARQLKLVGVHVNFAPVADVNNNPENPVINVRSFGENRYNVTVKSYMYMKGMQDNGVMACAKHFPGHGDTNVDSHYDLPVIPHERERLDSVELYPFRALAQHGIGSIMIAHLNVPALDDAENRPTSLSRNTVTNLVRKDFNFEGLIFTDGLEMAGVTKHHQTGAVEAEAILAGNDVLLLPVDIAASFRMIKSYLNQGKLRWSDINEKVKRVLSAKYRLGLTHFKPLQDEGILERLNTPEAKVLKRKLIEKSLTMVRNDDRLVPFITEDSIKLASLAVGVGNRQRFQSRLSSYFPVDHFLTGKTVDPDRQSYLINQLKGYDAVIVSIHNMSAYASQNYGLNAPLIRFLARLNSEAKVILVLFGTPYSLKYFDGMDNVLVAYEENRDVQDLAAQALFGAFSIEGRLPITASAKSQYNTGLQIKKNERLGFGIPEEVNLSSDTLKQIEAIATEAIRKRAMPGCVVLIAKDGKIVYNQAFGHHTYAKKRKVDPEDVYDLASITKIAASTISIMKLYAEGKIDLDVPLSKYLPELGDSNKSDIYLRDLLAHLAGFRSWIPFYQQTVVGSRRRRRPSSKFYQRQAMEGFSVPVTDKLFMKDDFVDSIRQQIVHSDLPNLGAYRYSDLGFYLVADLVKEISGKRIDEYAHEVFYSPLGLYNTTYNPWKKLDLSKVVPSEVDRYFRRQKVHGYVHDMGAAMMGGVSGHAGLFSNSRELAILAQMLLQGGNYGGKNYFPEEVVKTFTKRHESSTRRGLGFDLLETDPYREPNFSMMASINTYGHLGFTGTSIWIDPEKNLTYVFLSNRTYPSMHNYRIGKLNIRPRIQNVIYKALIEKGDDELLF